MQSDLTALARPTLKDFEEARQNMLRIWALLTPAERQFAHDEANATAAALRGIAAGSRK